MLLQHASKIETGVQETLEYGIVFLFYKAGQIRVGERTKQAGVADHSRAAAAYLLRLL